MSALRNTPYNLDQVQQEELEIGPNRFRFLDGYQRVKGSLEGYLIICATRLAIANLPNANLIPDQQILNLPKGDAFLQDFFSSKKTAGRVILARNEAKSMTARNVSRAIAPAAWAINLLSNSDEQELHQKNILNDLMKFFSMTLVYLLLKVASPGPAYSLERLKLAKRYQHLPESKDLMGLILDFERLCKKASALKQAKKHPNSEQRLKELLDSAYTLKEIIIQACITLEEKLVDQDFDQNEEQLTERVLALVILAKSHHSKVSDQIESAITAAEELESPGLAFDRQLQKSKRLRVLPGQNIQDGTESEPEFTDDDLVDQPVTRKARQ